VLIVDILPSELPDYWYFQNSIELTDLQGDDCQLISIEKNPLYAAIATKHVEYLLAI
jgi:hypothetical protein